MELIGWNSNKMLNKIERERERERETCLIVSITQTECDAVIGPLQRDWSIPSQLTLINCDVETVERPLP